MDAGDGIMRNLREKKRVINGAIFGANWLSIFF